MQIDRTSRADIHAQIICEDAEEAGLIRVALYHYATGHAPGNARRQARDAYELFAGEPQTDEIYRQPSCTGGMWCRCPVRTPCPQRGTSRVTGTGSCATA